MKTIIPATISWLKRLWAIANFSAVPHKKLCKPWRHHIQCLPLSKFEYTLMCSTTGRYSGAWSCSTLIDDGFRRVTQLTLIDNDFRRAKLVQLERRRLPSNSLVSNTSYSINSSRSVQTKPAKQRSHQSLTISCQPAISLLSTSEEATSQLM